MVEDTGNIKAIIQAGSVVELTGLRTSDLNGTLGVVKRFDAEAGRYKVVKSHGGNAFVGIKPENITQDTIVQSSDAEFADECRYQHVVFWPRVEGVDAIPVHSLPDWPGRGQRKDPCLCRRLGYVDLQLFSGVKSRGAQKPDFILYFDAADETSPINQTALAIKMNLPGFQISKAPRDVQNKAPRGPCVLGYCPTKTFGGGSSMFSSPMPTVMHGDVDKRFSLQQLRETLLFQESAGARPRPSSVFGGMT